MTSFIKRILIFDAIFIIATTASFPTCSEPFACDLTDSDLVDIIPNVSLESDCESACYVTAECNFYTWWNGPVNWQTCLLFSSCGGKDDGCSGCITGPKTCSITSSEKTTTVEADCQDAHPPPPDYGHWRRSQCDSHWRCDFILECEPGYAADGPAIASCDHGIWSPPLENMTCSVSTSTTKLPTSTTVDADCEDAHPPNNGHWGKTDCHSHWRCDFILECDPGYIADGPYIATCDHGIWSPSFESMTCSPTTSTTSTTVEADCEDAHPPTPDHGNWRRSHCDSHWRCEFILECDPGYTPDDQAVTTCDHGVWSPPLKSMTCADNMSSTNLPKTTMTEDHPAKPKRGHYGI